jgi:hypothetical protein
MNNTDTQTTGGNAPTHFAYQAKEGSQKSYWTRIGAAWAHKDGKGFSIQLESIPLDGKVTIRAAMEDK